MKNEKSFEGEFSFVLFTDDFFVSQRVAMLHNSIDALQRDNNSMKFSFQLENTF